MDLGKLDTLFSVLPHTDGGYFDASVCDEVPKLVLAEVVFDELPKRPLVESEFKELPKSPLDMSCFGCDAPPVLRYRLSISLRKRLGELVSVFPNRKRVCAVVRNSCSSALVIAT